MCENIFIVCNQFQMFSIILMEVEKNPALIFWGLSWLYLTGNGMREIGKRPEVGFEP